MHSPLLSVEDSLTVRFLRLQRTVMLWRLETYNVYQPSVSGGDGIQCMAENSKCPPRITGKARKDLEEVKRSCKVSGLIARKGKITNIYCVLVIHVIYMFNNLISSKYKFRYSPLSPGQPTFPKKDEIELSSSRRGGKWKRGPCQARKQRSVLAEEAGR